MHTMSAENSPHSHQSETPIDVMRLEIDFYDRAIIAYLKKRQQASNTIGEIRKGSGGPRINTTRENQIYESYSELGPIGHKLAALVLEMGRGPDLTIHEVLDDFKQGRVTYESAIKTLESRQWPTGVHILDVVERPHNIIGPAQTQTVAYGSSYCSRTAVSPLNSMTVSSRLSQQAISTPKITQRCRRPMKWLN